ncbi:uncharacterized protein LOC132643794 [Lycium barbarum]|uniref:uncharacterized protein LOC132643794 n=1 Tax=Lycium barbarum TaxID=112863 RepID=UPI00293F30EE|nr:uncharacterized protein LOC132643794 [Lycium barbarum]
MLSQGFTNPPESNQPMLSPKSQTSINLNLGTSSSKSSVSSQTRRKTVPSPVTSIQIGKHYSVSSGYTVLVSKYFQTTEEREEQDNSIEVTSQPFENTKKLNQAKEDLVSSGSVKRKVKNDKDEQTTQIDKNNVEKGRFCRMSSDVTLMEELAQTICTMRSMIASMWDEALGSPRRNQDLILGPEPVPHDVVPLNMMSPEKDHGRRAYADESDEDEIPLVFQINKGKRARDSQTTSRLINKTELVNVETEVSKRNDKEKEAEVEDVSLIREISKKKENKRNSKSKVTLAKGDRSTNESNPSKKRKSEMIQASGSLNEQRKDIRRNSESPTKGLRTINGNAEALREFKVMIIKNEVRDIVSRARLLKKELQGEFQLMFEMVRTDNATNGIKKHMFSMGTLEECECIPKKNDMGSFSIISKVLEAQEITTAELQRVKAENVVLQAQLSQKEKEVSSQGALKAARLEIERLKSDNESLSLKVGELKDQMIEDQRVNGERMNNILKALAQNLQKPKSP